MSTEGMRHGIHLVKDGAPRLKKSRKVEPQEALRDLLRQELLISDANSDLLKAYQNRNVADFFEALYRLDKLYCGTASTSLLDRKAEVEDQIGSYFEALRSSSQPEEGLKIKLGEGMIEVVLQEQEDKKGKNMLIFGPGELIGADREELLKVFAGDLTLKDLKEQL